MSSAGYPALNRLSLLDYYTSAAHCSKDTRCIADWTGRQQSQFLCPLASQLHQSKYTCLAGQGTSFRNLETNILNNQQFVWARNKVYNDDLCKKCSLQKMLVSVFVNLQPTRHTTTVPQPLYRPTCVSRHFQLRTRKVLVRSFTAHVQLLTATSACGLGREAGVLFNSVIYTVSAA